MECLFAALVSAETFYAIQVVEINRFELWFADSWTSIIALGSLLVANSTISINFLSLRILYSLNVLDAFGENFKK